MSFNRAPLRAAKRRIVARANKVFFGLWRASSNLQGVYYQQDLENRVRAMNDADGVKTIAAFGPCIDTFHGLYYWAASTHKRNNYFGHALDQNPFDLFLYQELIVRLRPAFVLQTGVFCGGSLLYFAHLLDLMEAPPEAIVVGIDIMLRDEAKKLSHPRIRLVEGSSTDEKIVQQVTEMLPAPHGFVSLDSDHSRDHVLAEMKIYERFVAPGGYMVVEDTNVNGHPVHVNHGPGPTEAVDTFLSQNGNFVRDDAFWRRNLLSHHAGGWLQRVS
jgi:cephalosporin hydroxylase